MIFSIATKIWFVLRSHHELWIADDSIPVGVGHVEHLLNLGLAHLVCLVLFFSLIFFFFFLCLKKGFYRDGEVFHNVGELSLREAVFLLLPLFRSLIRLAEWKDWFIKLKSLNWSQNSLFKGFLLKLGWFFNNSDNGASLPLLYHSIIHEARQEKEGEFEEKNHQMLSHL